MNFSGNPESLFEVDEENLFADYNEDFFSKHRNYIKQAEVKLEKWEERLQERERKIEVKEKEIEIMREVNLFTLFT